MKCTLGIVRTELTCVKVNEDLIFSVFYTFQESLFLILTTTKILISFEDINTSSSYF